MAYDILIVDDESDIRMLTAGIFEDEGHQTREAHDSATALATIEARRPNLVLLDIWLEGSDLDGMGILEILAHDHPNLPVVMMSGHGNIETAVNAINLGAYDFIEKPFNADRMILAANRAIEAAKLRQENEELRLRVGAEAELVGESNLINQLRQTVDRVAQSNSRVLITGPAGSGKDVVARLIHKHSTRSSGPFIAINCATLQPDGLEHSLFGSETVGDSGRVPHTVGTFEQAHNGTLFLDEVADMPLETQGKIVRVLQEQNFQRVGGTTRVTVDVRVIASSSRDLEAEMRSGQFREDLFYRLSVVPVAVPSLREHREDIPALALFFMTRTAETAGLQPRRFAEDAIATLQSYDWPGNVRELRNVVERILIMGAEDENGMLRADAIPAEISSATPKAAIDSESLEIMGLPLREAREIFERNYLVAQVGRFGGNISKTASFVGMERSALHRKLKSLGVQSEERVRAAND
ncbi:MAG: sigma-54 dependent transcriptional regulator [Proteobacteria bacterium]|nr:sigma-54 dependent transcriptional regulator [Pseudomonadota bacterium]